MMRPFEPALPLTYGTHHEQVMVIGGGLALGHKVKSAIADAQRQQKLLVAEVQDSSRGGKGRARVLPQKIAVNKLFFKRLVTILSM